MGKIYCPNGKEKGLNVLGASVGMDLKMHQSESQRSEKFLFNSKIFSGYCYSTSKNPLKTDIPFLAHKMH